MDVLAAEAAAFQVNPTLRTATRSAPGILGAVGSTPLVRLERLLPQRPDVELWLKLESANPGGSIKDRPALQMLRQALDCGRLVEGATVVESSSGNMGVGLAQACRYLGLSLICVVDSRACPEKIATMRVLGAQVVVVTEPDPVSGDLLTARIARVARLCAEIPGAFWPDQYENPSNPAAHAEGTMREICEQLEGRVDVVIVPASTSGTLAGCGQFLSEHGVEAALVAVDAEGSALFGGHASYRRLPGLGAGIETRFSRAVAPDRVIRVSELDCVVGCRRLVEREAVFAGASTGGVASAVRRLTTWFGPSARVAMVAPDGGAGYLDTVYDDSWVDRELGVDARRLEAMVATDGSPETSPE